MRKGIVKWFDLTKHYGFIHTERGDIFLHGHDWMNPNRPPLKDELIQFEIYEDKRGLKAIGAKRVNDI